MFEVQNQPPPLEPYNVFASDATLREAVRRETIEGGLSDLSDEQRSILFGERQYGAGDR